MTPPLFLVDTLPDGETAQLEGPEGRHAARVRRLAVGAELDLGDGVGGTARCRVTEVGTDRLELAVLDRRHAPRPEPVIVVVQALVKGARGELAVELLTEVGVDVIVPWAAARSVTRWEGDRGERARRRWTSAAREAAKQSRRPWVPEIAALHSTAQLAGLLTGAAAAVLLHEAAGAALAALPLPSAGRVAVVVGPEGGLSDGEVEQLTAAGATAVRLGPEVLRTSTAGVVAVAVLSDLLGRWR
ncbi:MAG: 16S rRNA (uracil(1498)-N(3))-methyltransferase [Geodermatophilaceae bacterium]